MALTSISMAIAVTNILFLTSPTLAREPLNPDLIWAKTFLTSQVMVDEYAAYMASQATSKEALTTARRREHNVELLQRAEFAIGLARHFKQDLGNTTAVRGEILAHEASLKSQKAKAFQALQTWQHLPLSGKVTEVKDTLKDSPLLPLIKPMEESLGKNDLQPSCQVSPKDLMNLSALQGKSNRPVQDTLEYIQKWPVEEVRCLAMTLMQKPEDPAPQIEPLTIFNAAFQTGRPASKDLTIGTLYAVRLIQMRQYAESLRILFDLAPLDPDYRALYDEVQKVFSYRQKGGGSVALRGL